MKAAEEAAPRKQQPAFPLWMRPIAWMMDHVEKLPVWARPAVWFALGFGAYSLIQILLKIPTLTRQPRGWLIALSGFGISVALGALVGLVYGGVRAARASRSKS